METVRTSSLLALSLFALAACFEHTEAPVGPGNCFAPGRNLSLVSTHPERGCTCDEDEPEVCEDFNGTAIALVCISGRWNSVIDGPCEDACFSPTRNLTSAINGSAQGCACEGDTSTCVTTEFDGRPWQLSLACVSGKWVSQEDGACGPEAGASCQVAGKTYANGATTPDPYSCNTCTCEDGEITTCTEAYCPVACPSGTRAGESCASCGPVDQCEKVETGCMKTCSKDSDCSEPDHPMCIDGLCRNVCG